jgi:pilus assembly protein Flp/PilA
MGALPMMKFLKRLVHDRSGAMAIEYALIAGLVSIAIVVGVRTIGSEASALYEFIAESVSGAEPE